ncbi:MAG: hypothetical protein IKZ86_00195 [Spirochaetaceae bacterium]|nr:hypothetical protein [Spirochaetaceae bacterium]
MKKVLKRICIICIILGFLFYIAIEVMDKITEENALNGYHEGEIYIVCDLDHENEHEVSKFIWYLSYYITYIGFAFMCMGIFSLFYFWVSFCVSRNTHKE